MNMLLRALVVCLFVTSGAAAQAPDPVCQPSPGERPVHLALLTHFQVVEGTVEVRPLGGARPAEGLDPAVGQAVTDFNERNAGPCPSVDGPVPGLSLLAGSHKTRLSRVGFDAAGTTAFAEITMIGGPETGSSHFVVLRKEEKGWEVAEDRLYRIF